MNGHEPATVQRFGFLASLTLVTALAVFALIAFVHPSRDGDPLRPRALIADSEIEPGEVRTFVFHRDGVTDIATGRAEHALFRVHLVRLDDGELRAFDARSTHRGCTTVWRERQHPALGLAFYFDDPCSGALFTLDGAVVFGPAPRALERVHVEVRDGLIVVDPSTTARGESRPDVELGSATPAPTTTAVADPSAEKLARIYWRASGE